jgi:O-antigen ligase
MDHSVPALNSAPHLTSSASPSAPTLVALPTRRGGERKPDALLWMLAAMCWTYVWRIQDLFPFLGKVRIALIVGIVALVLFVTDRRRDRRLEHVRSPVLKLVLAIAAILILGVPTSLWPGKSFTFLLKDFLPTIALMVMVAASVRTFRDLEWLARVNLIGAFFYALYALVFFDPGPSGRLGNLVYYDSNDFALLMMATMPIAVFSLTRHSRKKGKVFPLLCLGLFIMMLMQSGSRGGFLAFVAVMGYLLIWYKAIPTGKRIGTVLLGMGMLVLVANEGYWEKIRTLLKPKEDYNWVGQQYGGRMEVWKRGLQYMQQRPLLGVGARNFPTAEGTLSAIGREFADRGWGFKWSVAHNSFVEIGAEGGVIALGLFLAALFQSFRTMLRVQRQTDPPASPRERAMAQTLIAAFLGYVVAGFFLSAQFLAYLYVLLGMGMALVKIAGRESLAAAAAVPDGPMALPLAVARAMRPLRQPVFPSTASKRAS